MKKIYAIVAIGLLAFAPTRIQNSTPQSLPFTQNWTTITLITANDDWSGVPGIQGFASDLAGTTTGTDPQTLLADQLTIDVIANQTATTITNGGVAEFHITDPVIGLQGSGSADAPNIVMYLNTSGLQNINVAYNLRDIDGTTDNAVQAVALQYRVGNTGNFTNVPAGFVADATTGGTATQVTAVNAVLPAACNNQSEVQVRVITANAVGNDEWVGIDDINVTGSPLSGNSSSSNIITNGSFSTPANINYLTYQATDITDLNSIEVAQFTIQDGGGAADGDALGTILTNLNMSLSNSANIRRVALYDGTTELAEVAGAATVSFSGLSVTAADDASKTFSVRVTYNTAVTDNQQYLFTITSATADVAGSNFAAANAGGATSSVAGDNNRIEVSADRLAFVQNTTSPTGVSAAMSPAPTVSANDVNANRDLDFLAFVEITSTGTLLGSPVSSQAVAGLATFSGAIIHTATGTGFQLTAASTGLTSTASNLFDIQTSSSPTDHFRSKAPSGGNWGDATSWESSPDNVTWNGSTLIPDATANTITIRNGHTITVAVGAGGDQITVETGGTLALNAGFTLADGADAFDLVVDGTVVNTSGTHTFTGAITFNANSLYQHNRNGGAAPTATWNVTSTFEVTGGTSSAPSNISQTLGNFTWNSNTSTTANLVGNLTTVAGNFRVQNSGSAALRLTGSADLNLIVTGNFTVEDDLDIDNNTTGVCNISIGGNFSHTAGSFGSSTDVATISMTGLGRTFTQSGGTYSGTNINWVINTGAGLVLNNNLVIAASRSLALSGNVDLGNNNLVVAGTITGGSASAYVKTNGAGALTINAIGAGPVAIPVGNGTYNPLSISNGGGLNWTIRVEDAVNNVMPPFNTDKAINRSWHISPSAAVSTAPSITFNFSDDVANDIQLANPTAYHGDPVRNAQFWHYSGGAWAPASGYIALTAGEGAQAITMSGVMNFSPFAIAKSSGPLPVSLLSFSGYKNGNYNQLTWKTAGEQNNMGFEVQRSTDGINYTAIGFVNSLGANGNSSSDLLYSFRDNNPAGSKQYYRLRQVDLDNQSKLSTVIVIKGDRSNNLVVDGLYPNPASTQVNIMIGAPVRDKVTVLVVDMAGRTVAQKIVAVETGSNTVPLDISQLNSGTYMLKIVCNSNCETAIGRFIKQ